MQVPSRRGVGINYRLYLFQILEEFAEDLRTGCQQLDTAVLDNLRKGILELRTDEKKSCGNSFEVWRDAFLAEVAHYLILALRLADETDIQSVSKQSSKERARAIVKSIGKSPNSSESPTYFPSHGRDQMDDAENVEREESDSSLEKRSLHYLSRIKHQSTRKRGSTHVRFSRYLDGDPVRGDLVCLQPRLIENLVKNLKKADVEEQLAAMPNASAVRADGIQSLSVY